MGVTLGLYWGYIGVIAQVLKSMRCLGRKAHVGYRILGGQSQFTGVLRP